MCGILGAFSGTEAFGRTPFTAADLDRMSHRGPDGQGWFIDTNAVMGFRRLAIIDVAGGQQPLFSEDEQIVLTINGEIYNHGELRDQLKGLHRFKTGSDGEVLVHLYEDHGLKMLSDVNGMFAFALLDRRRNLVILGRDRAGKKPLYYEHRDGLLRWASEQKVLLQGRRPPINRQALNDYLRFGYVPSPLTIFQDLFKLPAATMLVAPAGKKEHLNNYWQLNYTRDVRTTPDDSIIAQYAEALRFHLDRSVGSRLESEVPLGFLLSGGVDSSSVVASGAPRMKSGAAHAFTVSFTNESIDESSVAAEVATRYGAEHHLLNLPKSRAGALVDIFSRIEEPVSTDALLPTSEVFAGISGAQVTTVLTGEGADEIFAGYRKFLCAAPWHTQDQIQYKSALERYLSCEEFVFADNEERDSLMDGSAPGSSFDDLECEAEDLDPLSQMLLIENRLRLPDRINPRLDRLSMAYSIEARAPFMDHKLMEFCATIPNCLLINRDREKWILREAMRERLPESVIGGRKAPFHVPDTWYTHSDDIDAVLGHDSVADCGLVNADVVQKVVARSRTTNERRDREKVFSLYMLHSWYRSFYLKL